jgi:hypothetical protein
LLFVFNSLIQFCDANLQPFYFPAGIDFVEHLSVLNFAENNILFTADKDSDIHWLK